MRVLVFGEILWDLIDGQPYLGGAPFNFAAHFARCGGEAVLVSSVGDDNLGWRALSEARQLNVESRFIKVHPQMPTGTVDVFLNQGEPDYHIIEDVAFDRIVIDEGLLDETFDIFYFGTLARRKEVSEESFRKIVRGMDFGELFYDVNLRKNCWNTRLLHESLSLCTIFKLNMQEVPVVGRNVLMEDLSGQDFCRAIVGRYDQIKTIIITDGSNGCFIFSDSQFTHVPGVEVKVVDAIGAGDSFSAVFMNLYKQTGDALLAAECANKVGAYVTSHRGAIPDYNDEIKELLRVTR